MPQEDYIDPINHSNLLDLAPTQRITINDTCYIVDDIHNWVILINRNSVPKRNIIDSIYNERIIEAYNVLHPSRTDHMIVKTV